jgi:hypothetical protein
MLVLSSIGGLCVEALSLLAHGLVPSWLDGCREVDLAVRPHLRWPFSLGAGGPPRGAVIDLGPDAAVRRGHPSAAGARRPAPDCEGIEDAPSTAALRLGRFSLARTNARRVPRAASLGAFGWRRFRRCEDPAEFCARLRMEPDRRNIERGRGCGVFVGQSNPFRATMPYRG